MTKCGAPNGLGLEDGISISSTIGTVILDLCGFITNSATFIGLDLGSAVVQVKYMADGCLWVGGTAGAVAFSGLTGSANFAANVLGIIKDNVFGGAIFAAPLNNLSASDIRLDITNSPPIINSETESFIWMDALEEVTISAIGTFVPIAGGNWQGKVNELFSSDSDGIVTYLGETSIRLPISSAASVVKTTGGTDAIATRLNFDTGSGFPAMTVANTLNVETQGTTENSTPTNCVSGDKRIIDTGDKYQLWLANLSTISNIDVAIPARLIAHV